MGLGVGEGPSPAYGASGARGVGFAAILGNQPQASTYRRVQRSPFGEPLWSGRGLGFGG